MTDSLNNLRVMITMIPKTSLSLSERYHFSCLGSNIHLCKDVSYLQILNSIQLVKVNTSSNDKLKLGQSFYIYFHFTAQYLSYDYQNEKIVMTKILSQRTLFKIISDEVGDWRDSQNIITIPYSSKPPSLKGQQKYKIILAEHSSKFLCCKLNKLCVSSFFDSSVQDMQNSIVYLHNSIYSCPKTNYPIKLITFENGLMLAYHNWNVIGRKKIGAYASMFCIEEGGDRWKGFAALRHIETGSYLVLIGEQLHLAKNLTDDDKYIFTIYKYDEDGQYILLKIETPTGTKNIITVQNNTKCKIGNNSLINLMKKCYFNDQEIENIVPFAWLKEQLEMQADQNNIQFILDQLIQLFQNFYEVYQCDAVIGLVDEGLLEVLEQTLEKYTWQKVSAKIIPVVYIILKISPQLLSNLFKVPKLYSNLMKNICIQDNIRQIQLTPNANTLQTLKNAYTIIMSKKDINDLSLSTILIVLDLLKNYGEQRDMEIQRLEELVQGICQQSVQQIHKKYVSNMYLTSLQVLRKYRDEEFVCKKMLPNLSVRLIENEKSQPTDCLRYIKFLQKQCPPLLYLATDNPSLLQLTPQIFDTVNHTQYMLNYIQDILPKNVRFETFQSKLYSLTLCRQSISHMRNNMDTFQCRKTIKIVVQNIDNLKNSGYQEQKYSLFLLEALRTLWCLIQRYVFLICEQAVKYDSVTLQIDDKIRKCVKELEDLGGCQGIFGNGIWIVFGTSASLNIYASRINSHQLTKDNQISLQQQQQQIGLTMLQYLKISSHISINFYPQIQSYMQHLKPIDQICQEYQQIIQMFLNKQHTYRWIDFAAFFLKNIHKFSENQISSIIMIIHKNDMYPYLCQHHDTVYKLLSQFAMMSENGIGGSFDGFRILKEFVKKNNESGEYQGWIHTDAEYILLRNVLYLIGGVVSVEVYQIYENYICDLPAENWTLSFFRLCECFFTLNPESFKQKFSLSYQHKVFQKVDSQKMATKLKKQTQEFILSYITLLQMFARYHLNKLLIYEIIGDQTLFQFLELYPENLQLKIAILAFMVKTRHKAIHQDYQFFAYNDDLEWFRLGTSFIRKETKIAGNIKKQEYIYLKDYTYAMIDFLKMREDMLESLDMLLGNQLLVVQGTNKLLAFEIVDLIQITVNTEEINRNIIEKIQWFQTMYKINVNTIELTRIAVDPPSSKESNVQFQYSYELAVKSHLKEVVELTESKMGLSSFITLLLKLLLAYSINENINSLQKIRLILDYLHFIVTYRNYQYIQQQITSLFLAMMQQIKYKNYREVALIQNIIRKSIWKKGVINNVNQEIVQKLIMQNKEQFCDYLSDLSDQYAIFSPIYSPKNNYFTPRGQVHINLIISQYIVCLKLLIVLNKSLNLKFKQIFAESSVSKKQFISKLIKTMSKHTESIQSPTMMRLSILTYQLDLINALMLGPEEKNIASAIKHEYPTIIVNNLILLKDSHDFEQLGSEHEQEKYRIILKMKKLISEALSTLGEYYAFSKDETRKIQQCLIIYYNQALTLYQGTDFDKIIISYNKKKRNRLQIMTFDLSLHLFYAIIKLYEKQQNWTIKQLKSEQLRQIRLVKNYNKRFKMFYQLYRVVAELIIWIGALVYKCCHQSAKLTEMDRMKNLFENENNTHQQKLMNAFGFFVKHVTSVQIQVGPKIQTVYYLLLKEAKCYNASIRKQLHRKIGLGSRQYRLSKFMNVSQHIILRLQVEKDIKKFTEKYKPFDIIIKNRQLWKSLNFLCACFLNLLFLELNLIENPQIPKNIIRGISYIFCIFLFIIYFIQNLPLKRKLASLYAKDKRKSKFRYIKSFFEIFNDKTLWFASIYFFILSLSFYQLGFVSLLMVDFFVRFKISKKVTEIVTRPIGQLVLIVLMSAQVAFVYTCYLFFIQEQLDCINTATCIQITYQQYLGLQKNIHPVKGQILNTTLEIKNFFTFFFAFFNIIVTLSLIIGVLLYEKKAKDIKNNEWQKQIKSKCFICDADRSIIDRNRNNNKGFFKHIQEQQNLWSYIFYLVYLKNKEIENMNVIQNMVIQQWRQEGIKWLPVTFRQ